MKYIVIKINTLETPILFPGNLTSAVIAEKLGSPVVSAALVEFGLARDSFDVEAKCFGFSTSLGKCAREEDGELITAFLNL